jgi:quercetin dioxygenase-like cupin family protein
MKTQIIAGVAVVMLGIALASSAHAQHQGVAPQLQALKREFLQTIDVPGSNYETVIGTSELGPNKMASRQSHPGAEAGYVLQGSGSILVDGQPPITLKASQSYKLAPGAVHETRTGPHGMKLIVIWVVEKGKPLVSPAN